MCFIQVQLGRSVIRKFRKRSYASEYRVKPRGARNATKTETPAVLTSGCAAVVGVMISGEFYARGVWEGQPISPDSSVCTGRDENVRDEKLVRDKTKISFTRFQNSALGRKRL